jgi:membrane protein DedA with SNARE-associated domain
LARIVQHLISSYGLVAVFVLMAAESACIPLPSEVTLLLGGALGNVAGSYAAWLAGRCAGRRALRRWGRYLLLRPAKLDRAQDWFERRGSLSVFWARLLPGIRTFISLPAGIAGMAPVRFGVYTLAGCLVWTAALTVAGYLIGANWQAAEEALRGPSYLVGGTAVVAIILSVLISRCRHLQRARNAPADPVP